MPTSDPKRDFAVEVVRRLQEAGYTALWAGGCVRDLLIGHPPDDYDVATNARPDEVRTLFGKRRTLAIGASFGVILVQGPKNVDAGDVEVATFRTEGPYLDGRRPETVTFATPEEDAHRRDFTINGMFYDPLTERIHDFVGGRDDLERRLVRAIGDATARFTEDKLRMLRAVRMTARFDFQLEQTTAGAVRQMAPEILVVSSERIAQELRKMLVHLRRATAMRLADDLKLLPVILPELAPILAEPGATSWGRTLQMLERLEQPGFELALVTLLFEVEPSDAMTAARMAESVCRRLRLSNDELNRIVWLTHHKTIPADIRDWRPSRLKRLMANPDVDDLLRLYRAAADCGAGDATAVEFCERFLAETPATEINPPELISGDDLIALGAFPGVKFKAWLEQIRDAQLDGTIEVREQALEEAKRLIAASGS